MRVLCPLDGSERSHDAMLRGLDLLKAAKPDVTLFCVQNAGFGGASEDLIEMFDDDEDDEIFPTQDSAQRMLDLAKAAAEAHVPGCKTKVVEGNVRREILAEAEDHDVVIMHRLGKSGLAEKLKMSGTESLCRALPCAVLLVED